MPTEPDFKRREAEIEKARLEILALQERIKKLVTRRHNPASDERKPVKRTEQLDK